MHYAIQIKLLTCLSCLFLFFSVPIFGQDPFYVANSVVFGGSNMDEGRSIAISPDTTQIIIGGRSNSTDIQVPPSNGGTDFWFVKSTLDGDTLWTRQYGGSNNDDLNAITTIPNGDVFAFGTSFSDFGPEGTLNGITGALLMRVDSAGNQQFTKLFSSTISEKGVDIIDGGFGNVILLGETASPEFEGEINNGATDYWISSMSTAGFLQWTFLYGGGLEDRPAAVKRTNDAGYIIAGSSNSNSGDVDTTKGGFDFWLVKLLANGTMDWSLSAGGSEDDFASDILPTNDGGFLVVGTTRSSDGDVSRPQIGEEDVWLIKVTSDGTIDWEKKYGGTNAETVSTIDRMIDGTYLIAGSSRSTDIDLTGNKGDSDYWIIRVDENGEIVQQMNYGGNQEDETSDMIVVEDNIYIFGSSSSVGGTLPFTNYPNEDAWMLQLSTDSITCNEELVCRVDTFINQNIIYPVSNSSLLCYDACNVGLPTGPDLPIGACPSVNNETGYIGLFTDENADFMTVTLTSSEFNLPYVVIAKTVNCTQFEVVECGFGFNGILTIDNIAVEPNTLYQIIISDAGGNVGDFRMCASVIDIDFCNKESAIYATQTSQGSPLEGPYKPGEEVTICYELTQWDKLDCNGFQGLVPTFGPGWAPESFNLFGEPSDIDTALNQYVGGDWSWYELGNVFYNTFNPFTGISAGTGMPAGWYFTNTDDPPPTDGPDDTTGDLEFCTPENQQWKLCFTLTTVADCMENLDCSITMKTYGDGELGSHVSLACGYDPEVTMNASLACCINPSVDNIPDQLRCSGDTIQISLGSNLPGETSFSWSIISADGGLMGVSAGNANTFSQILTNVETFEQSVTYEVNGTDGLCIAEPERFTITLRARPRTQMQLVSDPNVCAGDDIDIGFTNTGEPPFIIVLSTNGQEDSILLEKFSQAITVTPLVDTRYAAVGMFDRNCPGNATGVFDVTIEPEPNVFLDTVICDGTSFFLGDQELTESGNYSLTIPNSSEFGCDSTIELALTVNPPNVVDIDTFVCPGDTLFYNGDTLTLDGLYTYEFTDQFGCDSTVLLDLTETDEFVTEVNQTICFGSSVIFNGQELSITGFYSDTNFMSESCFSVDVLILNVYTEIEALNVDINSDNGIENGSIFLNIEGGTAPYDLLWSNGRTTESITDLPSGNYTLAVTDANGCSAEFNYFVPLNTSTRPTDDLAKRINLAPNPVAAGNFLYINTQLGIDDAIQLITISTMEGKVAHQLSGDRLMEQNSVLETNTLQNGVHLITFDLINGQRVTKKVVIIE